LLTGLFFQSFSAYYVAKSVISNLPFGNDPEKEQHEQARVKAAANLQRLNRSLGDQEEDGAGGKGEKSTRARKEELVLDQYENQIAMEVVAPEDIPVGFDGMFYPAYRNSDHANTQQISAVWTTSSKNSRNPLYTR
jgi:hypothetical protein